jgi:hypothetical protein
VREVIVRACPEVKASIVDCEARPYSEGGRGREWLGLTRWPATPTIGRSATSGKGAMDLCSWLATCKRIRKLQSNSGSEVVFHLRCNKLSCTLSTKPIKVVALGSVNACTCSTSCSQYLGILVLACLAHDLKSAMYPCALGLTRNC